MKPRGSIVVLACLLMLPLAANRVAQSLQVGAIEGKATDQSGAIVPGVTVTLTSPILLSPRSGVTDSAGAYNFASLPLGDTRCRSSCRGSRRWRAQG